MRRFPVAVNLSPRQFAGESLVDDVKSALDKDDHLFAIDATNNEIASVNLRADVSKSLHIQGIRTNSRINQR